MLRYMFFTMLCFPVLGDVIVLQNGNEIQGEVVNDDGEKIVVKFPGGTLELGRKQVKQVRRQSKMEYLFEEGEKLLRRGENEDAVATFKEALREDPASLRAQSGLLESEEKYALQLEDLGRYEDARDAFTRLLQQDPDNERVGREIRIIDGILEEARKEEARGREEIEGGNPEQGIWRLQRIFERFPGRRKDIAPILSSTIARVGDNLLKKQDWNGAQAQYQRALSTDPDCIPRLRAQHTQCKVRLIEPLVRTGDFTSIEKLAAEGLDVDPTSETLRYYRALAMEGKGKARDAAEEYLAILDTKRPINLEKAVRELRLQTETKLIEEGKAILVGAPGSQEVLSGGFRELRTAHFLILHRNNSVARDVAFVAEQSYAKLFRELGCATHLRSPIKIVIYPTQADYAAAAGMESWSGGAHRVGRKMGDLTEHTIYSYQDQPRLTTGILPHEIAHGLLAHRLNYPNEIPLWVNEGFAVLKEPAFAHAYYRRILLQEAARRALPSVQSLTLQNEYPSDRVEIFYAQSFSVVEFLVSLEGQGTLIAFLKAVSESRDGIDSHLRKHYKLSNLLALENRWKNWLLEG